MIAMYHKKGKTSEQILPFNHYMHRIIAHISKTINGKTTKNVGLRKA